MAGISRNKNDTNNAVSLDTSDCNILMKKMPDNVMDTTAMVNEMRLMSEKI
ncbi:MAG: hypothetical protein Kow0031_08210 [Anaerolineae bacterium]